MDATIIVETFNYFEGAGIEALRKSLKAATLQNSHHGNIEVLLVDVTEDPAIKTLLAEQFSTVRLIEASGLDYDEAKTEAVNAARSRYVVFLDGDCVPEPGWFESLTAALREGKAVVTGGFTRYPNGFLSSVLTVMDFGFLLPRTEHEIGCYASNNAAFLREIFRRVPIPQGPMRCHCYGHAQKLKRAGMPVQMAPGARVIHARPPFLRERLRQGYDIVAACWVNPELPEARLLRSRLTAPPLFYLCAVRLDCYRLRNYHKDASIPSWQLVLCLLLVPVFRLIDLVGIVGATFFGSQSRRWLDWSTRPKRQSRC